MEELNICTLYIQTSLPPNHPTSLKVKNMHNFAIFQWICMKLFMETLNVSLIVLANLQSQRSFGDSDLMKLVVFNHPPSRSQILFRVFSSNWPSPSAPLIAFSSKVRTTAKTPILKRSKTKTAASFPLKIVKDVYQVPQKARAYQI